MTTGAIFFALFSLLSLYLLGEFLVSGTTTSLPAGSIATSGTLYVPEFLSNLTTLWPASNLDGCACPQLWDFSYTEIMHAFWLKISDDIQIFYSKTSDRVGMLGVLSGVCLTCFVRKLMIIIEYLAAQLVRTILLLWAYMLWAMHSMIYRFVLNYFTTVVTTALLTFYTACLVRMVRGIFGGSVGFLVRVYKLIRRPVVYTKEKAVKGFMCFTIPQKPPRSSVLEVQFKDGSHAGYASCISLFNGETALLTAHHIYEISGAMVASTKTGTKIPLSEFKAHFDNSTTDLTLLRGPPNWEGLLGAKASRCVPVNSLAKSKGSIFHFDGSWKSRNCEIVGTSGRFATTLSVTDGGFSGAPIFNGKNILGVHVGAMKDDGPHAGPFNLMAPIPQIPGLTSPQYVFETTAPSGRLFQNDDLEQFQEVYESVYQTVEKTDYIAKAREHFTGRTNVDGNRWGDLDLDFEVQTRELMYDEYATYGSTQIAPSALEEDEDEWEIPPPRHTQYLAKKYVPEVSKPKHECKVCNSHTDRKCLGDTGEHKCCACKKFGTEQTAKVLAQKEKKTYAEVARRQPGNRPRRRRPPTKRAKTKLLHPHTRAERWRSHNEQGGGSARCEDQPDLHRENGGRDHRAESPEAQEHKKTREYKTAEFEGFFSSQYNWELCSPSPKVRGFESVGRLPQWYHPGQKTNSPWGEKLVEKHPELGAKTRGFGWPQFGAKAELKSLRLQAARWLERAESMKIPSAEARERVIGETVELYKNAQANAPLAVKGNKLSWDGFQSEFRTAVLSLEPDAGIGVPYIAYGRPCHRGWIEDPDLLPILAQLTYNRLQKMLQVEEFAEMTPEQLVREGLCDPIRVFVKGEPHKQAKLDEGRYRLIMSVSLVDQLVARVLFQSQNKMEIALWRCLPSKPGFGLSTDGQVREFTESLAAQVGIDVENLMSDWPKYLVPTDCSGFDWSVAEWMLQDEMEVRNRLTPDLNDATVKLRACWLRCISNSVLSLSDGTLLAQRIPGVQKSGSYNTSSSNSRIRVMAALHCGAKWCVAMGDDALEDSNSRLGEYKQLGFKVEVSDQLEFCSHTFVQPDLALPVNRNRMLYKLIYGYNPENGSLEVITNYLNACFSILNELRHDQETVDSLYQWLVIPVLPQNV
ncbi:P1-P2 fusion [Barleria polerovirus 1]|uniref:P1-P2 fusion n=1 Tax=Barleria polerovirus 1 TaxID=2838079 RepID=A0A8E7UDD9_9VIRU|nr:P1-P2 fusion [Barleria polerovirus 1]